jgi:large subunit ribosomal protein L30
MAKTKIKLLKITWVRSTIGYTDDQAATVRSLGLHRLNQTVTQKDTPQIRGMVKKISHLLKVEEVDGK